jgi:hypothetical protein
VNKPQDKTEKKPRLQPFNIIIEKEEIKEIKPQNKSGFNSSLIGSSGFKWVFRHEIRDYQFIITLGLDEKQKAKHIEFQCFEQYIIRSEKNLDFSTMKYKREIYKMIDMASDAGWRTICFKGIDFNKDLEGFKSIFKHAIDSEIVKLKFEKWEIPRIKKLTWTLSLKKISSVLFMEFPW